MATARKRAGITVGEVLAAKQVNLPGSDVGKTSIYFFFPFALLFVLANNPFFHSDLKAIEPYRNLSTLLLLFSLFLAFLSGTKLRTMLISGFEEISYIELFYGKLLIGASVLIFFFVVCLWVVVLGGIMSSPFASLLSMSPILLSIQLIRDKASDYDAVLYALGPYFKDANEVQLGRSHKYVKRIMFFVGVAPLAIVIFTLLLGQCCVEMLEVHKTLLGNGNDFLEVLHSEWYGRVYYFMYYLSVIIAAFGVLPTRVTKSLTRRFF